MRILAISDLHGDLEAARAAVEAVRPCALLSCGDWGDPDQIELRDLEQFTARQPVYTVYGNHDHLEALRLWKNRDGTEVLLHDGQFCRLGPLVLTGINGIWAKSHRREHYVTDADLEEAVLRVAGCGVPVDILLTHGCPSGVADLTWDGRHGGHRCFLRAFQALRPRVYLTGHLHRAQEYRTRDGLIVRNVGETAQGDAAVLTLSPEGLEVEAIRFR